MDLEKGPWKTDTYWVSHYQYEPEVLSEVHMPPTVTFHDTTLRDGEQSPGIVFSVDTKIQIAKMLDAAGIQFIEAGFPPVSTADRDAVAAIVDLGLKAKITCLSRATQKDIQLAADCGVWGVVMEIPGSQARLQYQFRWTEDEVIQKAVPAFVFAREKGIAPSLFIIDCWRTELRFLERLITTVEKEAGAEVVAMVDTTGCTTPRGAYHLVRKVKEFTKARIEMHTHNDYNLGVANTLAGLEAGASGMSGTMNALGQRGGNTAIEEVAWAVESLYGIPTGLNFPKLYEVALQVQEASGWSFPPNKPIVGKNIFTWEAGMPTSALRRNPHVVEPFQPEVFGRKHDIILGKKAGKANIEFKLEELGLKIADPGDMDKLLELVKNDSVRLGRQIYDEEFKGLHAKLYSK